MRLVGLLGLSVLLLACAASPPLPTEQVEPALTPAAALAEPERWRGRTLLWGGRIIAARNRAEDTELEVLVYPLGRDQRPDTGQGSSGRVLVRWPGYLETADYAEGRLLTVLGHLDTVIEGRVGQRDYRFPVVRAERLHLWPRPTAAAPRPRMTFGIGVMLGR